MPMNLQEPQELLEEVVLENGCSVERLDEGKTLFSVEHFPCPLYFSTHWTPQKKILVLKGFFELAVSQHQQQAVEKILEALNCTIAGGRFSWCKKNLQPIFQQRIAFSSCAAEQLEEILKGIFYVGEQLCEAISLLSSGKDAACAIFEAITPVMGEA